MHCKGIITYIDDGQYLKANQKAFLTMVLTVVYFSHLALTLVNTHLVTTLSLPFNDTWAFLHIPLDPSYHQTKGKKRKLKLSGSCKSGGYDEKCLQHFHVYRIRNTDWHWHSCNWKNARCLCKLLAHLLNLTRDENRWQQVHAIVSATLYKDVGCGPCSTRFHEHLYGRQFHSAHLNVYIPWKSTHTLQFQ